MKEIEGLTSFGSWRVAMLNHGDKFAAEHPARLERHLETMPT